jgi:hypothetical protein
LGGEWFEGELESWKHQADGEVVELLINAVASWTSSFWPLRPGSESHQVLEFVSIYSWLCLDRHPQELCDGDNTDRALAMFLGRDEMDRLGTPCLFVQEVQSSQRISWRCSTEEERCKIAIGVAAPILLDMCDGVLGGPRVRFAAARQALQSIEDQGLTAIAIATASDKLVAILGMSLELKVGL